MIQAILSYQFILEPGESGVLEPDFEPIRLTFNNKDFSKENYEDLMERTDIFAIFYKHTTGISSDVKAFSNFNVGRLKQTPYQAISHFVQDAGENQFITIAIFDLDDDVEIFEELIRTMGTKLEKLLEALINVKSQRNLSKIEKELTKIESEIKFTIFQVNRLSDLDKLQKVALIFQSDERRKILELLREGPISKRELKDILERIKPNPNIDVLIQPFLELNLIRRDWIKGITRKKEVEVKFQGEYLFLTKDIVLARFPSKETIKSIKDNKSELWNAYEKKLEDFFTDYDINEVSINDLKKLTTVLLNPDCFDFYTLMTNNYYPLDKLPKIFSDFVNAEFLVDIMEGLKVITKVNDKKKKPWVVLLTEIKPLIIFPEYLLHKLQALYAAESKEEKKISYEIAKKALELLEVTHQEKVRF
jgi:hypothetical protein